MVKKTIPLPILRLADRHGCLELTLRPSLIVDVPPEMCCIDSSHDLMQAVANEQLWIARKGVSWLKMSLTTLEGSFDSSDIDMAAGWIQEHEVWNHLGLRLVRSSGPKTRELSTQLSYSVQHPDLTSAMVAPDDALMAEFQAVTCHIDMSSSITVDEYCGEGSQTSESSINSNVEDEIYRSLDDEDRRAIDDFMASFGDKRCHPAKAAPTKRKRIKCTRPIEDIKQTKGLLEAAMNTLLYGGNKKNNGFRILDGRSFMGLAYLAPGVFHMPFLKAISERASFLPTIAASLARMTNAESPKLRKKVDDFTRSVSLGDSFNSSDNMERVVRGIEKATWRILLNNIKAPALKIRSATKQESDSSQDTPFREKEGANSGHSENRSHPHNESHGRGRVQILEVWDSPLVSGLASPARSSICSSPSSSQAWNMSFDSQSSLENAYHMGIPSPQHSQHPSHIMSNANQGNFYYNLADRRYGT